MVGMALNLKLLHGGPDRQRKLIFVIAGLALAAIVLLIASALIGRKPVGNQLNRIVAAQQEIIRINDLAGDFEPDLNMRQAQANVAALIASDIAALESHRQELVGGRLPKAVSEAAQNASAEDDLAAAAARGNLPEVYADILLAELNELKQLIETAQGQKASDSLQTELEKTSADIDALIAQLSAT
jgi:hypothetical protein